MANDDKNLGGADIEVAALPKVGATALLEDEKIAVDGPIAVAHDDYGLPVMGEAGLLKSRLDKLTLWKTAWVFRRATGYCVLTFAWAALEGWEGSISGQVVAMKGFIAQFGTNPDEKGVLALDASWLAAWGSIVSVGQLITLTYIGYVGNRWGKKAGFYWCWILFAAGLGLMTGAKTPLQWFFARLFLGMGGGIVQVLVGPYIMEVAPNRIRGGIYFFPWTAASQICCSVMMQQINQKYPDHWRLPIYILWATTGLMGICILFVPESPWYYARHGQKDKCQQVMRRLYGNIPEYDYEEEYAILEKTLEMERELMRASQATPWTDIFKGVNGKKTVIMIMLNVAQVFSGTSIMNTYNSYFFSLAGINDPFLVGIVQSVANAAFSALWAFLTDKVGRRMPYLIALGLQCLIMWIIGGLFYIDSSNRGAGLIFLSSLWSVAFGMQGCVNYAMLAELPSATLRMKTVTFAAAFQNVLAIVAGQFTPYLLNALNLRAGWVYAAISLPIFLFALYFLPDTKGRSVAEIDELFETRVKAWRWNKTVTEVENHMHATLIAEEKRGAAGEV